MEELNLDFNYHRENNIYCVFDVTPFIEQEISDLTSFAQNFLKETGFLFQTSGSTGRPKFVLHSLSGLKASALGAKERLQLTPLDKWLNVLSPHHMGGFSIFFRSAVLGLQKVSTVTWNIQTIANQIKEQKCSVVSMVPTQVFEIIKEKIQAPENLKAVLVGGGHFSVEQKKQAQKLGWNVLRSFGSTEAGSQIFTEELNSENETLKILSHYQAKTNDQNELLIKGEGLFKAYIEQDKNKELTIHPPHLDQEGYWLTEDRVVLDGKMLLQFLGRSSDHVKILGHLINLESVRSEFMSLFGNDLKQQVVLATLPDLKSENHLVLFKTSLNDKINEIVKSWNQKSPATLVIRAQYLIQEIPKTNVGKIKYAELKKHLNS